MKNIKCKERGITILALVVTIIVLLILAGVALNFTLGEDGIFKKAGDAVNKYIDAAENEKNILYNLESDMDNITGDPIPVKTAEQLLKIGSGEKVEIDGVEYFFNTGRRYILQNDIKTSKEYEKIAELIKSKEIIIQGNGNRIEVTREDGKEEYYTEDSKFYIAVNKYGYVLDGLELYYDGIDNAGEGLHDNKSSIWKDLSGNGHDGTLTNFGNSSISGWHNNYLSFDGVNDWVNCGEINLDNITLETVAVSKSNNKEGRVLIGNYENGGGGISLEQNMIKCSLYINDGYKDLNTNNIAKKNQMTTYSFSYDGNKETLYVNGSKTVQEELEGNIKEPDNNIVMAICANPSVTDEGSGYGDYDMYSVRIYNRGLSEEEIEVNNKADNKRLKNEQVIGISTQEELLNMQNGKVYELKNNITVKNG